MGFKSLLDKQVQGVMKTLGQTDGLAPAHTYVEVGANTYDVATRTNTGTETVYADVPMVLSKFDVEEIDNNLVVTTDLKILIASLDLSVTPKEDDHVLLTTGEKYMIKSVKSVPGNSLWIIQARKTN